MLDHTSALWPSLAHRRLFLTGGTGFIGRWLVETFRHANREFNLNASLTILSRNPPASHDPSIAWCTGDIRTFAFPPGDFSHIVHGATDVLPAASDPRQRLDLWASIVDGTRRLAEFAAQARTERLLLLSSGAVYGAQPPGLTHIPEDFPGAPQLGEARYEYGEGKRGAEFLCWLAAEQSGLAATSARLFALSGPGLPMDGVFALGNFVRDALRQEPIRISGDGSAIRSYLYAADLAIWLWTLLLRGTSQRAYNVGSEDARSIGDLAQLVSATLGPVPVQIEARPGQAANRYVPSTLRARSELNLHSWIGLEDGLLRMASWNKNKSRAAGVNRRRGFCTT